MRIPFSLLIACLCMFGLQAAPATSRIRGVVTDAGNGEPLEFVTVAVHDKASGELVAGMASESNGQFSLEVPAGELRLSISFIGYKTLTRDIKAPASGTLNLGKLPIEEDTKQIEEVLVVGQQSTMRFDIDKRVFNVGADLSSGGASASDILENIPSIEVDNDGAVSLRGNSSVTIWINGKPSGLTADNQGDILQQMPAENIEKVEVITNPGAKYSAEGTAGIINIVLKESARAGYYGSVQGGMFYLPHERLIGGGTNANINYNSSKLDAYGSLGFRHRNHGRHSLTDRVQDDGHFLYQTSDGTSPSDNLFARAGLTYRPTKKDEFGIGGFGMFGKGKNTMLTEYTSDIPGMFSQSTRRSLSQNKMLGVNAELSYQHKFGEDHLLSALASYNTWQMNSETVYEQEKFFDNGLTTNTYQRQPMHVKPNDWEFQLDYTNKFSPVSKVEAGYKFNSSNESSPTETWSGRSEQDAVLSEALYNVFQYRQQIHALYASYSGSIDNFGFQVGLRGEYDRVHTVSLDYYGNGTPYDRNRFDLFPTVFLSYHMSGDNELQLNYTRRIQRPRGDRLNSFVNITDSTNISFGNPALLPEMSNAFEFNYIKSWEMKHTLTLAVYFRNTGNLTQRINYLEDGIMKSTFENVAKSRSLGGEIISKNTLFKRLDLTTSVNLYYYAMDGFSYLPEGYTEPIVGEGQQNFSWGVRLMGNLALPHFWTVQARGMFRSRSVIAQGYRDPMYRLDAGVKKVMGPWSVALNIRDMLNSFQFTSHTSGNGFQQIMKNLSGGPRLIFNVTYSFGNMKPKPQKPKPGEMDNGMGDEEGGGDMF